DAGQDFAFEVFEAGSSAGGDVGDAWGDAGLLDCRYGVSAADNGDGVAITSYTIGDRIGSLGERRHLEYAHGTVPDNGASVGDLGFEERDRLGADVERHEIRMEGFGSFVDL